MKKILFTGGGSAGHVLPNVALMEDLLAQGNTELCYIGTNGIEKSLISPLKIPFHTIECPKLIRGGGFKSLRNNLKIPYAFLKAKKQAEEGLKEFRPDVVFSKGGYVSLPVVWAAKKLKIPCYTHESDFSAGLANKLAAKKCKAVFTSFPETAKRFKNGVYSGAPIRSSLLHADKARTKKEFSIPDGIPVLLVFGGGSGSKVINDCLRAALKTLTKKYFVLHVCGKGNLIDSNIKNYRQTEFISYMGGSYACADVVISRAGAGTLFELLALKKPALLIPLEGQTRGDQKENAEYFLNRGLCHVLPQKSLDNPTALIDTVNGVFHDVRLKENLQNSMFTCGNSIILDALTK